MNENINIEEIEADEIETEETEIPLEEYSGNELIEYVCEIKRKNEELRNAVWRSRDAYFNDIKYRCKAAFEKLEALYADREKLNDEKSALRTGMVQASMNGNTEAYNKVQTKIKTLDKSISDLNEQITAFERYVVKGDEELYQASRNAKWELDESAAAVRKAVQEVRRIADEHVKEFEHTINEIRYISPWTIDDDKVGDYHQEQTETLPEMAKRLKLESEAEIKRQAAAKKWQDKQDELDRKEREAAEAIKSMPEYQTIQTGTKKITQKLNKETGEYETIREVRTGY